MAEFLACVCCGEPIDTPAKVGTLTRVCLPCEQAADAEDNGTFELQDTGEDCPTGWDHV